MRVFSKTGTVAFAALVALASAAQTVIGPSFEIRARTAESSDRAAYATVSGVSSNALAAVAVTGPQSTNIADAVSHIADTNLHLAAGERARIAEAITNETDSAALAALATNRVTTTWDTNGHWYVESGGKRMEYWITETTNFVINGHVSFEFGDYPSVQFDNTPFPCDFEGFLGRFDSEKAVLSCEGYDGWRSESSDLPQTLISIAPGIAVGAPVVSKSPAVTNSIIRYLPDSPALTNETYSAVDQTNWMAVAGTNWVVQSVLDPWWFYTRADFVSSAEYGADWEVHLNPLITPDPHPQYAMHAETTNALLAAYQVQSQINNHETVAADPHPGKYVKLTNGTATNLTIVGGVTTTIVQPIRQSATNVVIAATNAVYYVALTNAANIGFDFSGLALGGTNRASATVLINCLTTQALYSAINTNLVAMDCPWEPTVTGRYELAVSSDGIRTNVRQASPSSCAWRRTPWSSYYNATGVTMNGPFPSQINYSADQDGGIFCVADTGELRFMRAWLSQNSVATGITVQVDSYYKWQPSEKNTSNVLLPNNVLVKRTYAMRASVDYSSPLYGWDIGAVLYVTCHNTIVHGWAPEMREANALERAAYNAGAYPSAFRLDY